VLEIALGTHTADTASLFDHGALYGPAVLQHGEWWRIGTGAFMHGGLTHLALNMVALWQIGRELEVTIGSSRTLAIYVASLVASGLAVVHFAPNDVTVGASGAIFGLFGALLAVGVRLGARGRELVRRILPIIAINLAFTFAIPFISKAGHLGGLVAGFIVGLALYVVEGAPVSRGLTVDVVDEAGLPARAELLPPEGSGR